MASDATPTKTGKRKDEKVAQKSIEAFASNPKMATGSISASAWHQDSHASCGRTRWHTPRAINIFYFPHDVPLEMGPDEVLAGSHLYATLATICVLIRHSCRKCRLEQWFWRTRPSAGSPNYSDQMRYVMKLLLLCELKTRRSPHGTIKNLIDQTSRSIYRSRIDRGLAISLALVTRRESFANLTLRPASLENEVLIAGMKSASQQTRLSSLYKLASKGASAVKILVDDLISTSGKHRGVMGFRGSCQQKDQAGHLGRYFFGCSIYP